METHAIRPGSRGSARTRCCLAIAACASLGAVATAPSVRGADSELLVDATSAPGDELGVALAFRQGTVVAGSPGHAAARGRVQVFDCALAPCALAARIEAEDGAAGDRFGAAVALDGDTLVVAAPGRVPAAVYVFVQAGSSWTWQARIDAPPGPSSTGFGAALDIEDGRLVVGADRADDDAGAVYVFARDGAAWKLEARLVDEAARADARLGRSVALHDDSVVAGAPFDAGDAPGGYARGAVHLFTRSLSAWTQGPRLVASPAADGDLLGFSVAFDGEFIAAGAPMANARVGTTVLFAQAGGSWSQRTRLASPAGLPGDRFGWTVALAQDAGVLVGAPYALEGCGSATLFTPSGASWNPTSQARLDTPLAATMAGWAVAASDQRLAVAAPGHAGASEHRGGVYVFGGGDVLFRDGYEPPIAAVACEKK